MHTFRAAQPALLYLSPACILSVAGLALVRGETKDLWGYVDGEEDEKERRAKEAAREKAEKKEE
jgi:minor histocompatibility antigen H13